MCIHKIAPYKLVTLLFIIIINTIDCEGCDILGHMQFERHGADESGQRNNFSLYRMKYNGHEGG